MTPGRTSARLHRIENLTNLASAQSHGRRLDPSSKRRVVEMRTKSALTVAPYAEDPLDLVGAWKAAKQALRATCYGRAAIAAHVLAIIPPALIDAAGNRHDPANVVNIALLREAVAWAERVFGDGSVFAGRVDLDEAGAGVADLFVIPVRERSMNGRSCRRIISVAAPLEELRRAHGEASGFAALQTSWWLHARATIDPRLERGTPKKETDRRHVHADVYRAVAAEIEPAVRAEANARVAAEIEARRRTLSREEASARDVAAELARRQADLEASRVALAGERKKLRAACDAIEQRTRVAVAEALQATRRGVHALLDGHIEGVDAGPGGRGTPVFAPGLTSAQRMALDKAIQAGWEVGLADVLAMLQDVGAGRRQQDEPEAPRFGL